MQKSDGGSEKDGGQDVECNQVEEGAASVNPECDAPLVELDAEEPE